VSHQAQKNESIGQLTGGVAHDFNNLLAVIMGNLELLRDDTSDPDHLEMIDAGIRATLRGADLTRSMLAFARKASLEPRIVDLNTLVRDTKSWTGRTLPASIRVETSLLAGLWPVEVDPSSAESALLNLILNARDACGTSGAITLDVRLVHDTWVEFVLTDTGPGFSQTALENAMTPFFTTKGAEGSGLGLAMVYDMAKSAGGDLRIANADTGARVTMRLPYRPAMPATTGLVLLIEDADDLRALVRDMLIGLGHSVIEAVSADEAMALLASLPDIALILSDIQLKGEASGLDLAQRLAPDAPPLILMTSLPPDDALFLTAQKLAPVLRKPFALDDLRSLISPTEVAAQ